MFVSKLSGHILILLKFLSYGKLLNCKVEYTNPTNLLLNLRIATTAIKHRTVHCIFSGDLANIRTYVAL